MKNLSYRRLFLIMMLMTGIGVSNIQAQDDAEAEEVLRNKLTEFVQAYQNLIPTKNKQAVLQHFDPEATSNIYVFNISGKSRSVNSNVKGYEAFMDKLLLAPNVTNVYELAGEPLINVSGDVATITYKVNYEIKEEDGIWVKGNEVVTLSLEKRNSKWLIVHYTIVQIEDEKLKGTCICELFLGEGEDAEVVSKTIVPSGRSYSTKFDNFLFRTTESGDWVIKSPQRTFKRMASGQLVEVLSDGDTVELGVPASKKETVLMILREGLYKDSCARIKMN